jgi:flagellar protein FlaJ
MTWRERLEFKLAHRYKVKRSIFTLAVPAVIAIAIMFYALYTGYAPIPFSGGTSLTTASGAGSAASAATARQAAYAALVAKLNPGENSTTVATAVSSAKILKPPNPHNFDLVLIVSMMVGLGPYAADVTMYGRKVTKYEADFADFLFELSELVRGGIDPIKATITLSQGSVGSITKPIRMVAKQMQIGYTFEQSMRNLAFTLNSPLVDKYVDLVIQASYSGGSVANLIQRASADMSMYLSIEKEKKAGLSQYMLILYAAQVILIALSAILVVQFLPDLKSIATLGSTSFSNSILGKSDIGNVSLERDLWFLVVINGFLGGLVIGKLSEGKIRHGLKHGLVLVLIGFLAWTLFVVPASSGAATTYNITAVSYPQNGIAGLQVTQPIIVKVTENGGTPGVSALVDFTITGPGSGGTMTPSSANTDSNGTATSQVKLGSAGGQYTITATVGNNSTSVIITATGNSGGG